MTHKVAGRQIVITEGTLILVQTGIKGKNYKTYRKFVGKLAEAILCYNGLKCRPHQKKRLLIPSSSFPTLFQEFGKEVAK